MAKYKNVTSNEDRQKDKLKALFEVHIKSTDIASVSLLQTLNNVRPRHMFKI